MRSAVSNPAVGSNRNMLVSISSVQNAQELAGALEAGDAQRFADSLAEFDSMTRLDAWKTGILLKVIACPCTLQSLTIPGASWQHSLNATTPEVFQAAPSGRSSVVLLTTSLAAARFWTA